MAGLPIIEILTGLSIGSRLFLVALGLSLIFGVLGVLNFAHGALYMVGAYVTISLTQSVIGNFWVAAVVGGLVVGLVGLALEMGFIRRVYDRDELDQLILTFAFVLIISDLTRTIWGSSSYTVAPPSLLDRTIPIGDGQFLLYRLFVIVFGFVAMVVFWYVLQRTHIGRLIRATSSDRQMAQLLGTNVSRLYTGVFVLGSIIAGIGGALAAPLQAVTPALGDQVIISAFIVVVIGGLGSFVGAFVGAMFIGLVESFGTLWIRGADLLLPFLVMIAVLILRPEGLFGGDQS